ncbi:MAG: sigma-70 family RNA polymerase sigma factor [Acholeplasmataceae bacterium]
MSEKEMIVLIAKKNEKAFEKLYNRYHKLLFTIIFQVVNNYDDSADITQDVFMEIWNKINNYNGGNFKYWCISIARNKAIDFVRRKIKKQNDFYKYCENLINRQMIFIEQKKVNDSKLLIDIRKMISCEEFQIIELKLFNKLKFKEIAYIKDMKVNSVTNIYYQALKKIKTKIGGNYEKYYEDN